jgi:hypothetical protein
MIFAAATDEKSLFVFPSPEEAIAHCEAIDAENGGWMFWDGHGAALQPQFITPNYRGPLGIVGNGTYQLVADQSLPSLTEALGGLRALETNPLFQSLAAVQAHLAAVASLPQHGA